MSNSVNPGKVLEITSNFHQLVHKNFQENNRIFFEEIETLLGKYAESSSDLFALNREYEVTIPNDFNVIEKFRSLKTAKHGPSISFNEEDLMNVTDKLQPGAKYQIKVFIARKRKFLFQEYFSFLKEINSLYVGAQGALLLYCGGFFRAQTSLFYLFLDEEAKLKKAEFGGYKVSYIHRGRSMPGGPPRSVYSMGLVTFGFNWNKKIPPIVSFHKID